MKTPDLATSVLHSQRSAVSSLERLRPLICRLPKSRSKDIGQGHLNGLNNLFAIAAGQTVCPRVQSICDGPAFTGPTQDQLRHCAAYLFHEGSKLLDTARTQLSQHPPDMSGVTSLEKSLQRFKQAEKLARTGELPKDVEIPVENHSPAPRANPPQSSPTNGSRSTPSPPATAGPPPSPPAPRPAAPSPTPAPQAMPPDPPSAPGASTILPPAIVPVQAGKLLADQLTELNGKRAQLKRDMLILAERARFSESTPTLIGFVSPAHGMPDIVEIALARLRNPSRLDASKIVRCLSAGIQRIADAARCFATASQPDLSQVDQHLCSAVKEFSDVAFELMPRRS